MMSKCPNIFISKNNIFEDTNGEYEIVSGKIQLIVAIPPVEVSLKMDDLFVTGPILMNLEKRKNVFIDCIATGARPAPQFKWYIEDELLKARVYRINDFSPLKFGTTISESICGLYDTCIFEREGSQILIS